MDPAPPARLVVGLVRGLHGLRGLVRVEALTDDPDRFTSGSVVFLEGADTPLTVEWVQADGPGLLVRFAERSSREAVEDLRDRYLEAVVTAPLADGSYYWHEIIDVPVTTGSGELLGRVADVFRAGGGEILTVRGGPRGEMLVPAVSAVIVDFAPREGRIVVDPDALDISDAVPRSRVRGRRTTRARRAEEEAARGAAASGTPPEERKHEASSGPQDAEAGD